MKILVIGGTRFFGIPMVEELLEKGHDVVVATRGRASDGYGNKVERILVERTDGESMKRAFRGRRYDVVIDKIAYCSNEIRYVMDAVEHDRYIYMSSAAVYDPLHMDTVEDDFDGTSKELIWCGRTAFAYAEGKRQAERALWQAYPDRDWAAIRYPFVLGRDDYTKRLLFYVEHIMKSIPMNIDNLDHQMSYIRSDEAGKFMAFVAGQELRGAVNGCSGGTISLGEIIKYVEQRTGTKAVITAAGEDAPYNGVPAHRIDTGKANAWGYQFSELRDWICDLLDYYIRSVG